MTQHWISYSHSDQVLLRDETMAGVWDALVIPGTLAAYYFEGTGGFVLAQGCPYVIDPRTPLLQTNELPRRPIPRASHLELLKIHDPDPSILEHWPSSEIAIDHWLQPGRWQQVVERVLEFQQRYSENATGKIDKYAQLLAEARGEQAKQPAEAKDPIRYVPPYWAVTGADDPWWELSCDAVRNAVNKSGVGDKVIPILATTSETPIPVFSSLVNTLPQECTEVFCWRGNWDEKKATKDDVDAWISVTRDAATRGIAVHNMYGGFLSVLMTSIGLAGFNHGIGYSEARDVRRLGETGAPPVRYYVPSLHNFETVPNAQPIIDHLPAEWSCKCPECVRVYVDGRPIVSQMDPMQLKRHFMFARNNEIQLVGQDVRTVIASMFDRSSWIAEHPFPEPISSTAGVRLRRWAESVQNHLS